MPAYLVAEVQVHDAAAYSRYSALTPAIIGRFGGRFLARGGLTEVVEGTTNKTRVVIVEFPSMDVARNFYDSPEYQQARELRLGVSEAQFILVDGVP